MAIFGNNSIEASTGQLSGSILGLVASSGDAGNIASITAYLTPTGTRKVKYALYRASNDALLGVTEEISISSAGWHTANFASAIAVGASTSYYILGLADGSYQCTMARASASSAGRFKAQSYASGFPDPSGTSNNNFRYSIYATYEEEAGGGDFEIADESSASSIDNIDLIGNFQVANEASTSLIDNITIERNGGDFVVADAVSSSSVENISIQQSGSLLIADIETTSSIENITLEVGGGLFVVENETSPSSIDNINLEQNGGTLAVGDMTSTPEIENIGLIGNFIIGDVVCETTTEQVTIEFEGATFEIKDIASTSEIDNIPLVGDFIIQDINAPPTIENITLEIANGDFVIGNLDSSSAITNIRIVKDIPDELKTIFIVNRGKVAKWISGNNYIEL